MQTRFLLGPAGSGKTVCCLNEIRAALRQSPDGPPLILVAPKQATFQLERQLLSDKSITGFTRLHIFSFDKLARFVLEQLNVAPPALLSSEGRVMVLRALLMRHEKELKLFNRSARRPGFAQELSGLLAELQQHQLTPAKLNNLSTNEKFSRELRHKLGDLALLHEHYTQWLTDHGLQDTDCLLDHAIAALRQSHQTGNVNLQIQALWLDGFAEMTPQELTLLAAVVPLSQRATLAFCLETEPTPKTSWLSIWSSIGKTFLQCRAQITNVPGCVVSTEILKREPDKSRFPENSPLAELENKWSAIPVNKDQAPPSVVSPENKLCANNIAITRCANPEAEATFAAREILKSVRTGIRFRDCAVLVRSLDNYYKPLARIFRRYGIPFFLDRRETITHHPLAELTRSALRTVTFDWQPDDWFAALKSGFSSVEETEIDRLENKALEFGWRGKKWREPLPDEHSERLRKIVFPPFEQFYTQFSQRNFQSNGEQLAAALRQLWQQLNVEATLDTWTTESEPETSGHAASPHATVWEQMNAWLDNLTRAFSSETLSLREWLPILEAGLSGLTVGVIPPALDQVLVGAIDRARNPDLKFCLVLGANESVFPATPMSPVILTNADRDELETQNTLLGPSLPDRVSRERYLGYIACTRASERLAITFARQDADGKTLNPSSFIAHLQNIFPRLATEEFTASVDLNDAQHACELASLLANPNHSLPKLAEIPELKSFAVKLASLREPSEKENLPALSAEKLYGPVLNTSVSRLEEFAACPFKFFVRVGLHAKERKTFELDARERGNFQHDVLKAFHDQLTHEGKRWRDLTPAEARERIGHIANEQMQEFRNGLFQDSAETLFAARAMAAALQDFVEIIVDWMHSQYEFDPAKAELGFGGEQDDAPAWKIDLHEGHALALNGRIDRVDLWCDPEHDIALAVVTDYKSSSKKLDPLLVENGLQLQLLGYLGTLRHWQNPEKTFGAKIIKPVGTFYVSLRGKFEAGGTRDEILEDVEAKKLAYRHLGRFDASHLQKFDHRHAVEGDQFKYKLNKKDHLPSKNSDALPCNEFTRLLDNTEEQLRELGSKIYSGAAEVDPYRKGKTIPCDYCDYRAVCRIDEWTHEWRVLNRKESVPARQS